MGSPVSFTVNLLPHSHSHTSTCTHMFTHARNTCVLVHVRTCAPSSVPHSHTAAFVCARMCLHTHPLLRFPLTQAQGSPALRPYEPRPELSSRQGLAWDRTLGCTSTLLLPSAVEILYCAFFGALVQSSQNPGSRALSPTWVLTPGSGPIPPHCHCPMSPQPITAG